MAGPGDPLPPPRTRRASDKTGLLTMLGYVETTEIDREGGRVTLVFQAALRHCNFDRVVQGGIVTGWLDVAMASAVFAMSGAGTTVSSLEIKTAYYAPVPAGEALEVTGWVERLGRRTVFLEGEVRDPRGKVLAKASSTATVRSPKREGRESTLGAAG